ncbi:MAG TPA: response regulator transcription factor [Bryobacteraceae bacterium]|nr:response regulator transcription factor [Bryobacteraceae bacterium]
MYSVLLVSSYRLTREAVKALIERHEDFKVIGEADDRGHTLRLLTNLKPDVILFDLDPEYDAAIESIRKIIKDRPGIKIVALSMHSEDAIVESALRSGVCGYMSKGGSSADVVEVLRTVARDGAYLSPVAAARVVDWIKNAKAKLNPALENLTQREVQVLRLLAEGKATKEVAISLDLGVETIRTYRKKLMKKLKVHNVTELIQFAVSAKVIVIAGPEDGGGDPGEDAI